MNTAPTTEMTTEITTRAIETADLPLLLTMNNAAVPNVGEIDADALARLVGLATVAEVVVVDGEVHGFVLAMPPGTAYESPNYRWFCERYDDFLYVDRIVVADGRRGGGLGVALYDAVFDRAAKAGAPRVTCEVNLEPPNPGSMRFHQRLGFTEAGQLSHGPGKRVVMLARNV